MCRLCYDVVTPLDANDSQITSHGPRVDSFFTAKFTHQGNDRSDLDRKADICALRNFFLSRTSRSSITLTYSLVSMWTISRAERTG